MARRGCYLGAFHQERESKGPQGELSRASDALSQERYRTAAATVPPRSDTSDAKRPAFKRATRARWVRCGTGIFG